MAVFFSIFEENKKVIYTLIMQSTLSVLSVYCNENRHPPKNLYMDVHTSFIIDKAAQDRKQPNCWKQVNR